MSNHVVEINTQNWNEEVLQSDIPVLVDFWASWCTPCKVLSPILDDIAKELNGKLKVAKVDCEQNMSLVSEMGVKNIPALFFYVDGIKVKKSTGSMNKASVLKFIGDL